MAKTFINVDPTVNAKKFWQVKVEGRTVTTTWGRIGQPVQGTRVFTYPTFGAARDYVWNKVNEKLGKGYVEVGAGA